MAMQVDDALIRAGALSKWAAEARGKSDEAVIALAEEVQRLRDENRKLEASLSVKRETILAQGGLLDELRETNRELIGGVGAGELIYQEDSE